MEVDETYYNEEATESFIALDFPDKSEHIFDFNVGESKDKEEDAKLKEQDASNKNGRALLDSFDKQIEEQESTTLRVR